MPGAGGSLPNFWDQGSAPFSPRHFATLQTRAGGREGAQGFPQTPIHAPEPTAGPKDEAPGSKRRERRVAWLRKVGEHTQAPTWIKYQQNTQTEPTCLCSRLCQPVVAAASAEMTWLRPRGRGAPMRLTMPTPSAGSRRVPAERLDRGNASRRSRTRCSGPRHSLLPAFRGADGSSGLPSARSGPRAAQSVTAQLRTLDLTPGTIRDSSPRVPSVPSATPLQPGSSTRHLPPSTLPLAATRRAAPTLLSAKGERKKETDERGRESCTLE